MCTIFQRFGILLYANPTIYLPSLTPTTDDLPTPLSEESPPPTTHDLTLTLLFICWTLPYLDEATYVDVLARYSMGHRLLRLLQLYDNSCISELSSNRASDMQDSSGLALAKGTVIKSVRGHNSDSSIPFINDILSYTSNSIEATTTTPALHINQQTNGLGSLLSLFEHLTQCTPESLLVVCYEAFLQICIKGIGHISAVVRKHCTSALRNLVPLAVVVQSSRVEGGTGTGVSPGTVIHAVANRSSVLSREPLPRLTESTDPLDRQVLNTLNAYVSLLSALPSCAGTSATGHPGCSEYKQTLRSYQVDGVTWLTYLRRMGLHGCLADDMVSLRIYSTLFAVLITYDCMSRLCMMYMLYRD